MPEAHFSSSLFRFLRELEANNDRDWFQANKHRYEDLIKEPALQFIADCSKPLKKISPEIQAIPKAVGGSLFRIYRDVRFSKDKSPYKTHVGIHFRHAMHRDAHAPGFYLHLANDGCFAGAGIWRPAPADAAKIRAQIGEDPSGWRRATGKRFADRLELSGDSLVRPPKGFDAEHPQIEDLKRKDFIGVASLTKKTVTSGALQDEFLGVCRAAKPLMAFLCRGLSVPF